MASRDPDCSGEARLRLSAPVSLAYEFPSDRELRGGEPINKELPSDLKMQYL